MLFTLGFGDGTQDVEVPDRNLLYTLLPNNVKYGLTGEAEVKRALQEPIGSPRLRALVWLYLVDCILTVHCMSMLS